MTISVLWETVAFQLGKTKRLKAKLAQLFQQRKQSLVRRCWTTDPTILIVRTPRLLHLGLLELLSLSSFTDWIKFSSCLANGATMAFILLSTSLEDNFLFSSWDCNWSSTSLVDSPKAYDSPNLRNCRVSVLISLDIVVFLADEKNSENMFRD